MHDTDDTVTVDVLVKHETKLAFLVEHCEKEMWIPKSQIVRPNDYGVGELVEMEMSEWIAIEKGLV